MVAEHESPVRSRIVPLPVAIGCIAAETIIFDHASHPVLHSGERIDWNTLIYLAQITARGAICTGASDPRLLTIRVIDESLEYDQF